MKLPQYSISILLAVLLIFSTFYLHSQSEVNHLFFLIHYFLMGTFIFIFFKRKNNPINVISSPTTSLKATSNSLEVLWIWDLNQKKFFWSKNISTQLGYDTNEVENELKWLFDKIHPQDHMRFSLEVYHLINEKQKDVNYIDIVQIKTKQNEFKYFQSIVEVQENEVGEIQLVGSLVDVSKFKNEEIRLQLLESVILNSKEAILILEGNQEQGKFPKVLFTNQSFEKITGYSEKEIQNDGLEKVFVEQIKCSESYQNCIEKLMFHQDCIVELPAKSKEDIHIWLQFSFVPIFDKNEEITHFISIIRDITLEKEREVEREKLIDELQKSLEDLKQFSYITSHNFRAPLSNLLALNELIKDYDIQDANLLELIHGYQKSTLLLNDTIEDLIQTIVIRDTEVTQEWLLIEELINNIEQLLKNQIKENKVHFTLDLNCKEIWFNKSYAENIFLNLISNAIKYKNPNNEFCNIEISSETTSKGVLVKIKDNGRGMNLDLNKEKIFGLYQRFHPNTEGKGIGLYLVKNQMKASGGEISVDSEVNIGTTFHLIFKNPE
jgi:PAS domain S-box-containing protein